MTYYVSYLWRSAEHTAWIPSGAVCDEHPLDWVARCHETWGKTMPGFQLVVMFFAEIPESVYRRCA